jgi:hypothetical protein
MHVLPSLVAPAWPPSPPQHHARYFWGALGRPGLFIFGSSRTTAAPPSPVGALTGPPDSHDSTMALATLSPRPFTAAMSGALATFRSGIPAWGLFRQGGQACHRGWGAWATHRHIAIHNIAIAAPCFAGHPTGAGTHKGLPKQARGPPRGCAACKAASLHAGRQARRQAGAKALQASVLNPQCSWAEAGRQGLGGWGPQGSRAARAWGGGHTGCRVAGERGTTPTFFSYRPHSAGNIYHPLLPHPACSSSSPLAPTVARKIKETHGLPRGRI